MLSTLHSFSEGRMSVQLIVEKNFSLRVHSPCVEQVTMSISNSLFLILLLSGFERKADVAFDINSEYICRVCHSQIPTQIQGGALVGITLLALGPSNILQYLFTRGPSYQMIVNKAEPLISIQLCLLITTGQNSEGRRKELLAPLLLKNLN